jgi:hypothetical protein
MFRTAVKLALFAAVAAASIPSAASAQSWQSFGTPTNVGGVGIPFWNRNSDDNVGAAVCNVGAVLTNNPALTSGSCTNQDPAAILPYIATPVPTVYLSGLNSTATPFFFGAGLWKVELIGRIAGVSSAWSTYDAATNVQIPSANFAGDGFFASNGFYLGINTSNPAGGNFFSNAMMAPQQFAVFGTSDAPAVTDVGGVSRINWNNPGNTYYVGIEDNACPLGGQGCTAIGADYDYNDVMLKVTAVPEPGSIALMAVGMLGLAALSARRRRA